MHVYPPAAIRSMASRNVSDFLNADSQMARLSSHAGKLLKLQRIFERAVPAVLVKHCRVANMKLGKVVVHASNASVAAKLRQLTPRLTEAFRQAGVDVNEIQVKVQPGTIVPAHRKPESPAEIGMATKQGLTTLAHRLPEDSPLRSALERFAERAKLRTKAGR